MRGTKFGRFSYVIHEETRTMASRSQNARAENQRRGVVSKKKARKLAARKTRAERARGAHENERAAQKANRVKGDASLNIREELVKTAPTARQRRDSAQTARVRGSGQR